MESGRETERERAARARKQTRNHDTAAAYGPLCVALVYTLSRERERELARARGREDLKAERPVTDFHNSQLVKFVSLFTSLFREPVTRPGGH